MSVKLIPARWQHDADGKLRTFGRPPVTLAPPVTPKVKARLHGTHGFSTFVPPPDPGVGTYPVGGPLPVLDPTAIVAAGQGVWFHDLVQPTDAVSVATAADGGTIWIWGPYVFQAIVNRVPSGKKLCMRPGKHVIDSTADWRTGPGAVRMPKTCAGIVGWEPPGTGWDDLKPLTKRTCLQIAPNIAGTNNVLGSWFQTGFTGSIRRDDANIHFEGVGQGTQTSTGGDVGAAGITGSVHERVFTNYFAWNQAPGSTARDILSTGAAGTNGAPPGETFNFEWYHCTDGRIERINTDGRRAPGGKIYSAVGISFGYAVRCVAVDCYSHHNGHAGWVNYITYDCETYNLHCGHPTDRTTVHATLNVTNADWLNHELTGKNRHYNTLLYAYAINKAARESVTHSGRAFTFSQDGVTYDVTKGTLEMIDPTIHTNLLSGGQEMIWVSSWGPLYDGQPSTYADGNPVPVIRTAAGARVPARWNYGSGWINI